MMGERGPAPWMDPAVASALQQGGKHVATGAGAQRANYGGNAAKRVREDGTDAPVLRMTPEDNRVLVELVQITAAKMRTVEHQNQTTYMFDNTEAPTYKAVAAAGQIYAQGVKGKPNHKLGSPHAFMATALLKHLMESLTTEADQTALQKFHTYMTDNDVALGNAIPVVRKGLTYTKKGRLVIGYSVETTMTGLPKLVDKIARADGAIVMTSEAPRGPKERQLSELLGNRTTE